MANIWFLVTCTFICQDLWQLNWSSKKQNLQTSFPVLSKIKPLLLSWYPSCDAKSLTWYGHNIIVTWPNLGAVNIPNSTFLVYFSIISGLVGLTVGILAWLQLTKIQIMTQQISPDMPLKHVRKVQVGITTNQFLRTNIQIVRSCVKWRHLQSSVNWYPQ